MNIIEKRKNQLKWLGLGLIILSVLMLVGGIVLTALSHGNVLMIVFGVLLIVLSLIGAGFGIAFAWIASALKATAGSLAEGNLGIGTANMHKCTNCGAEVAVGQTICAKCEENLKP